MDFNLLSLDNSSTVLYLNLANRHISGFEVQLYNFGIKFGHLGSKLAISYPNLPILGSILLITDTATLDPRLDILDPNVITSIPTWPF